MGGTTDGMRVAMAALMGTLILGLVGCDDLNEFRTDGDVFRGKIIGTGSDVFTQGFEQLTYLELDFDPERAEGRGDPSQPPGTIHTYHCEGGAPKCDEPISGPIEHAPLELFPILSHDVLSDYSFPGASRLRNYIMSVHRKDGTTAMVFVSLMESGDIEVRLIAPKNGEPGDEGLFGVFPLSRQQP